jgi:tetratricopeptide (TPR) repeat protein
MGTKNLKKCWVLAGIAVVVALFIAPEVSAEGVAPAIYAEAVPAGVGAQIADAWKETRAAVQREDVSSVHEQVQALVKLRDQAGASAFQEFSLFLIAEGERLFSERKLDEAAVMARSALQLSPHDPTILSRVAGLAEKTKVGSQLGLLLAAVGRVGASPQLLTTLAGYSIVPFLVSLTAAVYLAFVLFVAFWVPDILRGMTQYFPAYLRGIMAPMIVTVWLIAPIALGPLTALVAWSLLVWTSDRRCRWTCAIAAAVILAWVALLPVRDRIVAAMRNDGAQTVLRIASGTLGSQDQFYLRQRLRDVPDDGAAWFLLAQQLRKSGEITLALEALQKAGQSLKDQDAVTMESATLSALKGDLGRAKELLRELGEAGVSSAEYFYNRSKVEFLDLDTGAARDSLLAAEKADPLMTSTMRTREADVGAESPVGYADPKLSTWWLIFHTIRSAAPDGSNSLQLLDRLMPGFGSTGAAAVACGLLILCAVPPSKKRRRILPYYGEYVASPLVTTALEIIPGGAAVTEMRPLRACIALMCFCGIILPALGWPVEARELGLQVPMVENLSAALGVSIVLAILVRRTFVRGRR